MILPGPMASTGEGYAAMESESRLPVYRPYAIYRSSYSRPHTGHHVNTLGAPVQTCRCE